MLTENDYYSRLIVQAIDGDRDDAISLLNDFAYHVLHTSNNVPASLVAHIAQCIGAWLASECDPRQAARAFHVERPANRPKSGVTSRKIARTHIKAWRAYYLMRGRGKGYDTAKKLAASSSGLSISMVKKLVEGSLDTELSKEERTITEWDIRTGELSEKPIPTVLGSKGETVEQRAALWGIRNLKVQARCLNPPKKARGEK